MACNDNTAVTPPTKYHFYRNRWVSPGFFNEKKKETNKQTNKQAKQQKNLKLEKYEYLSKSKN